MENLQNKKYGYASTNMHWFVKSPLQHRLVDLYIASQPTRPTFFITGEQWSKYQQTNWNLSMPASK